MFSLSAYLRTTIGQKKLMGLSGLGMSLFVLTHMAGNMLLLVSADAYNTYSHKLITNPLIYIAEAGLVALLLIHVWCAITLTRRNWLARPVGYVQAATGDKRTSFVAKSLVLSGLVILVFIVLHLLTFKYGPHYETTVDGVQMRDLHKLVMEKFQEPLYVVWYLFSLLVLAAHLSHGVKASFQSLGVWSANNPTLRKVGLGFTVLVAAGFISQPLYAYFFFRG